MARMNMCWTGKQLFRIGAGAVLCDYDFHFARSAVP